MKKLVIGMILLLAMCLGVNAVFVDIGDSPIKGDTNAPVTLVEFMDYQGPYCRSYHQNTYPQILTNYVETGKVKIVIKNRPLHFFEYAKKAAEATLCFREQRGDVDFFNYHDKIYDDQDDLNISNLKAWAALLGADATRFNDCLDSDKYQERVEADINYANSLDVLGVPTFFVNGEQINGARPYGEFQQEIENALQDDNEARITALESWKTGIDLAIQSIANWLFFFDHDNVCEAALSGCQSQEIECYDNDDCPDIIGEYLCAGNNVNQQECIGTCVDPGVQGANCQYICSATFVQACPEDCEQGECVQETPQGGTVVFRTNAIEGNYKSGTWIALDTNSDDNLEGYDYSGSSGLLSECKGTILVNTPEGYATYLYNDNPYVCIPSGSKFIWKKYYQSSSAAVTSSSPLQPYSSSNQEVYSDGTSPDGGSGGEGGGGGGIGVNVTIGIGSGGTT